jgi:hypothetical protein
MAAWEAQEVAVAEPVVITVSIPEATTADGRQKLAKRDRTSSTPAANLATGAMSRCAA